MLGCLCLSAGESAAQKPKRPQQSHTRKPFNRPGRAADTLKVGDLAPNFSLKNLDGPNKITLSDHRGKKPVVLVFGSYT